MDAVAIVVRKLERIDAGVDGRRRGGHRCGSRRPTPTLIGSARTYPTRSSRSAAGTQISVRTPRCSWCSRDASRYRCGDVNERAKVADYARSAGVPEQQLDWIE
jgi:hypothetical protein